MTGHSDAFRVKTVQGVGAAGKCAKHNLREIQAELGADSHISAIRSRLNIVLHGGSTSGAVIESEKRLLRDAEFTRPMRKNQVRLIEIVFSVSPDSNLDLVAYFGECWTWGQAYYGISCISAVIHNDESAPHMHALYVPCVNGKMCGSALLGGKEKIRQARQDCIAQVGSKYGLKLSPARKHLPLTERKKMTAAIIRRLCDDPQLLNEPTVRDALTDILVTSPQAVYEAIKNPIGNCAAESKQPKETQSTPAKRPEKTHSLSCVGNSISDHDTEAYSRTQDDDYVSSNWDDETGEFVQLATQSRATVLGNWL